MRARRHAKLGRLTRTLACGVVKQKGELALAGKGFPNVSDQCRPYAPPFTFAMQLSFQMLQKNDGDITIIYNQDDNVRHIRMNATHPTNLLPSPMGDAVGHWEGETLVIDTVGIKTNAFSAADMYGTPQSASMHVIERYRLIDGNTASGIETRHERSYFPPGVPTNASARGDIDPDTGKKGLQVEVTVEDPVMFTRPWTGIVTYRHAKGEWAEAICAENPNAYYGSDAGIPVAGKPDF